MALTKEKRAAKAGHDLRSIAFVARFVEDHKNDNIFSDRSARVAALMTLLKEHKLRGLGTPYGSEAPWEHDAQSLLGIIVPVLKEADRRATGYANLTTAVTIQDAFFQHGNDMLSADFRAELQAILDAESEPRSQPDLEEDELTAAGVPEVSIKIATDQDESSFEDPDTRRRVRAKTRSAPSKRNQTKTSKPKLSRRDATVRAEEIEAEEDENLSVARDTASLNRTARSRSSRNIKSKAQSIRRSTKQDFIATDSEEDDDGSDEEVVTAVPKQKTKTTRAAMSKPAAFFPNLGNRRSVPTADEDGPENQDDREEDEMQVVNNLEPEVEGEDGEIGMDLYVEEDAGEDEEEVVVIDGEGSVGKKRSARADFEDSSHRRKKAKVSRGQTAFGNARSAGRSAMPKEASDPADVFASDVDNDEDEEPAPKSRLENHDQHIIDDEETNEPKDHEPSLHTEGLDGQHSRPSRATSANGRSDNNQSANVDDQGSKGMLLPISSRQPTNASYPTTSEVVNETINTSSEEDIVRLDLPHAMLKVGRCLDQALNTAFPVNSAVQVANFAMEPSRSLTRLYIRALGLHWLNRAQNAMDARALLQSLIWHYLVQEVLSKEVLSDTVYTVLRNVRTYLEPVLNNHADGYSSVVRRASQAQFEDSEFIKNDVIPAAHELKTKLMMTLRPHLDEIVRTRMPESWRKNLSKLLVEVCRQAVLLRAKLEMEQNKHKIFVFNYPEKLDDKHMEVDGGRGSVVLLTKVPGITKAIGDGGSDQVVVKALVVLAAPDEMYD